MQVPTDIRQSSVPRRSKPTEARGAPLFVASDFCRRPGFGRQHPLSIPRVSTVLDTRDEDIIKLMKDSDVLFRALVARRDAVHELLVSSTTLSKELTALIRQSRDDLKPALAHLENVIAVLNKNEDNLDNSLRLMAPFYRVFANTLGNGPWFDTYIQNMPPLPQAGG